MTQFEEKIRYAINYHSKENGSSTPDFILATYLVACLAAFDAAVVNREKWYGRGIEGSTALDNEHA